MPHSRTLDHDMTDWPLHWLWARADAAALQALTVRMSAYPDTTMAEIARLKLAGLTGFLLQDAGLNREEWNAALAAPALAELTMAAQRKQAMVELNRFYQAAAVKPILLKGAATSRLCYPQEILRWSSDIDLLLPLAALRSSHAAEIQQLEEREYPFARFHLKRSVVQHFPVEIHFRACSLRSWGTAEDLYEAAAADPEMSSLLLPDHISTLTVICLHLLKHRAVFPYDLIDAGMLLRNSQFDWHAAAGIWMERSIVSTVLPGLKLIAAITGKVPDTVLQELQSSLTHAPATHSLFLHQYLTGTTPTRLQQIRAQCLTHQLSFAGYCLASFVGSRVNTSRLTGLSRKNPIFWVQHVFILPVRRLYRVVHEYLTQK